jgi:hypothetical protein
VTRANRLLPVAVGVLAFVAQLAIFDRWFGLLDEGYVLAIADDINRGHVLYRDVYVDAPFPGAFYLLAAWFRLLGPSIRASRWLMVAAFALFAALVTRIGQELLPPAGVIALGAVVLAYRVWAFPHWHVYSYSTVAATALTAAVALVFAHLRSGTRRSVLAAGALAGAGILCKQDYGLAVSGAVGLFLLARPLLRRTHGRSAAPFFALGAALVLGPAAAALAGAGALRPLVTQAVLLPLSGARNFSYTRLPPLRPLLHQDPLLREQIGSYLPAILLTLRWEAIAAGWLYRETPVWDVALKLLYYVPFLTWTAAALLWGGTVLRATAGPADDRRLLLLAWAGGFLLAFNPPRDWVHLMMIYPPELLVMATLLAQTTRAAPRALHAPITAAVAALVALLALGSARLALDLRAAMTWPLATPRGGVRVDPHNGPIADDVVAWIAATAAPGAPVPVYPIQPMLDFLSGRESAAGFHVIWPVQAPDRDERVIAALEQQHVDTIVYSLSQYAHLGRFQQNAPRLFAYLVEHFEIVRVFCRERWGPLLVGLRRRAESPPAITLLDRLPPDAPLARVRWPFEEAMAPRAGTADGAAAVSFSVRVPADAPRLRFRYGVDPDRWPLAHGPFVFAVDVDGRRRFHAALDPASRVADRAWFDGDVDLAQKAGQRATLTFALEAPPAGIDAAGWAEPRIASGGRRDQ